MLIPKQIIAPIFLPVFLSLFCVGCASPQSRAKDNPAVYGKLTPAQQQLALKGRIGMGMSQDAVFIALGRPERKKVRRVEKGEEETWIYFRTDFDEVPRWSRDYYRGKDGRVYSVPRYDPIQIRRTEPDFEVKFTNGKVTEWSNL
jgi:hypothetical protein